MRHILISVCLLSLAGCGMRCGALCGETSSPNPALARFGAGVEAPARNFGESLSNGTNAYFGISPPVYAAPPQPAYPQQIYCQPFGTGMLCNQQ